MGSDVAVGGLVVGADGVDVGAADGEGVAGGGRLPDDGQNSSRAGVKFSCNYCNALEQMRKRERNIQDNVRRTIYTTTTSRQIVYIHIHRTSKKEKAQYTYKSSPPNYIPIQHSIILQSTSHSISPQHSIPDNLSTRCSTD